MLEPPQLREHPDLLERDQRACRIASACRARRGSPCGSIDVPTTASPPSRAAREPGARGRRGARPPRRSGPRSPSTGKPSPARHSTTKGVRTNGFVQSACGQSCTRTTGTPSRSAWRTSSSSAGLGSPAITCTSTELRARRDASSATTAPGSAPSPSWRASCSREHPGHEHAVRRGPARVSSRSAPTMLRTSRSAGAARFTERAPAACRVRGSPGERRSARDSRPSTSLRPR